jgi:predicted transcriptional regulator
MTLPFELTTMPEQALDILRYMGANEVDNVHADALMMGIGMSERSFSKGIKRLVTKGYMAMDEARFYRLTQKGYQAIEDVSAYDKTAPTQSSQRYQTLNYDLCAVVPTALNPSQPTRWHLGLEPDPMEMETLQESVQLLLRVSSNNGQVAPAELTLTISSEQATQFAELSLTLAGSQVRVLVEAFQLMEMDEPLEAGGMYFDIGVGQSSQVRALHSSISIAQI